MVVQHNLTAMNSNRMLGATTSAQAKSTEKLSSGYKINRAADDAAGLSISEKMRKQIRGLTQASSNAQDGISAVQTAEGALNEVQDMLQRMNELAVKSSNGTMSENDRSYIQNEIDALTTEIDRVAETTKFNETYLLKGDKTAASKYTFGYSKGTATITPGTTLYKADGTEIKEAGDLVDYLAESTDNKVYTTPPKAGKEAAAGTDYTYTAGKKAAGTANSELYIKDTAGSIASGGDVSAALEAATNGTADATLKAGTLYKGDTGSHTISKDSGTNKPQCGDELTFFNSTSGEIATVSANTDLSTYYETADGGTTYTLKADYKLVTAAVISDVAVTEKGGPSTATKIADRLYDADGNELADDGKVKDYLDANSSNKIYSTKPIAGTEASDATDYTFTKAATVAQYYDKDGNRIASNALSNYFETADGTTITQKAGTKLYDKDGAELTLTEAQIKTDLGDPKELTGKLTLSLHVGADSTANNQINVDLEAMSTAGLGIKNLKVDGEDDTNALDAIDTIKEAIQKVSTQRSTLGAAQNRLEHTISNLDNVVENTTSAESAIRDTDMATEMVKYSNNNILSQAGQAMLAQANQSNQGVLSLLQ